MTSTQYLRLPHTLYLPLNPDGSLTEPTELRISVQRLREHDGEPKPSRLLTVHPHMEKHHLLPLYSEYVPSRRIPADVQAMVDMFNADIDRGWKALLVQHYIERADRAVEDHSKLEVKLRGIVGKVSAARQGDSTTQHLLYAENFAIIR